ncbi:MAG: hypothetical protein GY771_16295 [bacterium]|nr:hypothetical protein [bacterium]
MPNSFVEKHWLLVLATIILIGVALRFAFVFYSGFDNPPTADGLTHYNLGLSVAEGRGFTPGVSPKMSRMPGYSYAIAPLLAVYPYPSSARFLNIILSLTTIVLIFVLGKELWNRKVGLTAAFLFAIYPSGLYFVYLLINENLTVFLNVAALLALLYGVRNRGYRTYLLAALAGLLWGAATLCVANTLITIFLAPLFTWLATRDLRRSVIIGAVVVTAAIITITPWTVRNYELSGRIIPIRTQGGLLLYGSNNALVLENEKLHGKHVYYKKKWRILKEAGFEEWEIDDYYRNKTVEFIKDNPAAVPKLLLYKFGAYWTPYKLRLESLWRYVLMAYAAPVLLFIILGLVFIFRRGPREAWYLAIPFSASQLGCLVYFAAERFKYPAMPFILLAAAVGAVYSLRFITDKTKQFKARNG